MSIASTRPESKITAWFRALHRVVIHGSYRPEVDGLRFLAIAFVIVGHLMEHVVHEVGRARALTASEDLLARLLPAAQTGVLLFFAISGYILAAQFKRRWLRKERLAYGAYFHRRLVRIAPPYLVVLVLGNIAILIAPSLSKASGGDFFPHLVASVLYVHGIVFGELPRGFPPGWSLEIEVQFYLVAPFLFFSYFRFRPRGREIISGVITTILFACWMVAGQYVFGEVGRYYFAFPKFLGFFWIGLWLADLYPDAVTDRPAAFGVIDVLGLLGLTLLGALGTLTHFISSWNVVAAVEVARMLAVLLVFFAAIRGQFFRRLFSIRPIAFLGSACYSFYLVHLQIVQIMTTVLVKVIGAHSVGGLYCLLLLVETPIIVLAGLIFYGLVERPFQLGDPLSIFRRTTPLESSR
ncbi:acyltransferase family protein [Sphingomonas sp. UYP23]